MNLRPRTHRPVSTFSEAELVEVGRIGLTGQRLWAIRCRVQGAPDFVEVCRGTRGGLLKYTERWTEEAAGSWRRSIRTEVEALS